MAKRKIENYIFKAGLGINDNAYPNAYFLLTANKTFIQKELVAWIQANIDGGGAGFVGYTYNSEKCERDSGYIIDALAKDLRYGGNKNVSDTVKYYWDRDVSQLDGSRQPEILTYQFFRNVILPAILSNTAYNSVNETISQTIDTSYTAEPEATTRLIDLINLAINVIGEGLSNLPENPTTGLGHVKLQGRYRLEDILLITNTTTNEIIYNFSNPDLGAEVLYETKSDSDYTKFLDVTDTITTLKFKTSTVNQSDSDELQIFTEEEEIRTRPFDFGTDAIERMRIAPPLSMLDADFEYGLQPTKWSAIATMRGYPSIYEIPGTDIDVVSVVTDASQGTGGIGQSLITVTTAARHGFTNETPIIIKALETGISGASRAEGSFVITRVIDDFTFQYYAKSKVGNTAGEVLATNFTLLREGGFYTGADIGNPEWTVLSQGINGNITNAFITPEGRSRLTLIEGSDVPEIGAPIDNETYFEIGTQVTGIAGTDGVNFVGLPNGNINIGDTSASFGDVSGILIGHAVDNGTGEAIFVTNIVGSTVTFDGQFTANLESAFGEFTNVSGTTIQGTGSNAQFDISKTGVEYNIDSFNPGEDYKQGDTILITGDNLGGVTPDNDATITITEVNPAGNIITAAISGTAFTGDVTFSNLTSGYQNGNGSDPVEFEILVEDNTYTASLGSPNNSTGYAQGDLLFLQGTAFPPDGTTPTNDIIVKVESVGIDGQILTVSTSGTAPDVNVNYSAVPFTQTGVGVDITVDVQKEANVYTNVFVGSGGTGYTTSDVITVLGTDLGGISPDNDLNIVISEVDENGTIISFRLEGPDVSSTPVAANRDILFKQLSPLPGSNAEFEITSDGVLYTVNITNGGTDYGVDQEFVIPGNLLGGTTPNNDATLQITEVNANREITSVTISGTPAALPTSFTDLSGSNLPNDGAGATFDIINSNGTYSVTVNTNGADYKIGNQIQISGSDLGGSAPANNVVITVTSLNVTQGVATASIAGTGFSGATIDFIGSVTVSEPALQAVPRLASIPFRALGTLQVTFTNAHGLVPGDSFIVTQTSDNNSNNHDLVAGSFLVTSVPTPNTLTYQARAEGFINTTGEDSSGIVIGSGDIEATLYPRPDSFFVHRPYDGGVQLGTGGPQHGAQAIRQSKKYIRYQSGKGIMYTTGALFAPSYDLLNVTSDGIEVGSTITITTDDTDHGVQIGGIVRLLGIETPGYNSGIETATPPEFDYTVTNVVDERTFQVTAQRRLGGTTAELGFGAQMSVVAWHGATVRSGIFDDQNGIFWEYDGTQISVVQRTSTRQLAGNIAVLPDSNLVNGTNTRFRDQIKAGDRIVIKGMTHVVSHVISQTEMTVTPDFRGVTAVTAGKLSLVVDKKIKQSDFNLDRLDGTGPSGYKLDPAKMQMIGIQYSWYGAGFIDYMLRGADGNFVFCHRIRNSNVNTEAFMRSGNLPVRYEVSNEGPPGRLAEDINDTQTTITLDDASFFPVSGTIYINNEIIRYAGKTGNNLTGCTRAASLTNFNSGATRTYTAGIAESHNRNTGVVLISNTISPNISHWGSAFITDGMFDEDRGYIFNYTESAIPTSTTKQTALLMRLAPSVSNAITGDLGERELLNRAQLLLQGIEITSDGFDETNNPIQGGIVIEGILNPKNYPLNVDDVTWSGLSTQAQGGQPSFTQIASGGGIDWNSGTTQTTASVNWQGNMSVTGVSNIFEVDAAGSSRDNFVWVPLSAVDNDGIRTNMVCNTVPFNGATIRSIFRNPDFNIAYLEFNQTATREFTNFPAGSLSLTFSFNTERTRSNTAFFTKDSWDASGAAQNTEIDVADTNWPAGTVVNTVTEDRIGSTTFYRVTFNNSSNTTLNAVAPSTVTFLFGQPPYALPGETVFSFIAQPGERATIDLNALKELTNTTLGGRGTFPNGPDVLAINVYKVSGLATTSNIIIKWGEAQA